MAKKPGNSVLFFLFSGIILASFLESGLNAVPVAVFKHIIPQDSQNLPPEIFDADVVFVGEIHNRYSNHLKQLDIIRAMYEKDRNLAVGMEMFSFTDQKVLDLYVNGEMDEKSFLKLSHYFTQWGYDYRLYKDILDFCRKHKIRILGLNTPHRLTSSLYRNGPSNLLSSDLELLPRYYDFDNERYENRLYGIFSSHPGASSFDFRNFLFAQLTWDETMAEQIAGFVKENPNTRMAVLAGNGHIEYGDGIPSRLNRRIRVKLLKILLDSPYEPSAGDYFIYTKEGTFIPSPILGVHLSETENGLKVEHIAKSSVENGLSLKPGDVLTHAQGEKLLVIADLRIVLLYSKSGDEFRIRYLREGKAAETTYRLP